jgi:hypothetical protein
LFFILCHAVCPKINLRRTVWFHAFGVWPETGSIYISAPLF